jgi:hypothetical protein
MTNEGTPTSPPVSERTSPHSDAVRFRRYPNRINAKQARALAALFEGRLKGTTFPNIVPPGEVAFACIDDGSHSDTEAARLASWRRTAARGKLSRLGSHGPLDDRRHARQCVCAPSCAPALLCL